MKIFVAIALLVAAASALPAGNPADDKNAEVIQYRNDNIGVDGYGYGYQTSNGISADEQAELKNRGTENEALSVRGQFSYIGPDGVTYAVTYVADENGFQPSAQHLPKN